MVIGPAVLVFAAAVTLASGVMYGIIPALSRRAELVDGLKEGARSTTTAGAHARQAFVAAQVAISFVLLIGADLLVHSFVHLTEVNAGFNADRVLTMRLDLDWVKYGDNGKSRAVLHRILDRLEDEPGVKSAAIAIRFPLDQSAQANTDFMVEGHPLPADQPVPQADFRIITPSYFRTVGMQVLRGRAFTEGDRAGAPDVAIVN